MSDSEIWEQERRLWLEGAEAFDELLSADCVMAFAAPVGLLTGLAVREAVAQAPRWAEVTLASRTLARPDGETRVLGYRAHARRSGGDPYHAFCTSTYRRLDGGWRLVQHQQTPDPH